MNEPHVETPHRLGRLCLDDLINRSRVRIDCGATGTVVSARHLDVFDIGRPLVFEREGGEEHKAVFCASEGFEGDGIRRRR